MVRFHLQRPVVGCSKEHHSRRPTLEKDDPARWLKPMLVGQFEFTEWTPDNHLRHSRFAGLREDKQAGKVGRET
jgi:ATP-dependent DNA ligase